MVHSFCLASSDGLQQHQATVDMRIETQNVIGKG